MFEHSQEAIQDLSKQLELAHSVTKKLEVQALNSAVHHKRINEEVGEPCSCCLTSSHEASDRIQEGIAVAQAVGFDLIFVETSGIGQGQDAITDFVDHSVYVMTSEFGAETQLEKIEMLDVADTVVLNKFEKRGAEDALHLVGKQVSCKSNNSVHSRS